MTLEFTVDILEQKKDRLFVTGMALSDISLSRQFTRIYQYGSSKKSKKHCADIDLTIESIIVDGESAETISTNAAAMLVLSGDASPLLEQADALGWRKKSGRIIRTSETALTLAKD